VEANNQIFLSDHHQDLSDFDSDDDSEESKPPNRRGNTKKSNKTQKYKKVKSLGHFCQQFIILFVSWKRVISLEEAARQISDDEQIDEKTLKTKIRRLYDIANVLQSIGLIAKTQMSKNRKPAFRWVGLHGAIESLQEIKDLVKRTREVTNHAPKPIKEAVRKYPKTADPSPNMLTPNLMKCNAIAASFRGFTEGFSLEKGHFGCENKLSAEEFKCEAHQENLFDGLNIDSGKPKDQFTIKALDNSDHLTVNMTRKSIQ